MGRARRRGYKQLIEADLNIMPLMNLFVVLIPMLLLSAVFVELSVIDLHLPTDSTATEPENKPLRLAVLIGPDAYTVSARGWKTRTLPREDQDALGAVLAEIATRHPENTELAILSPSNTAYQDIITVMDLSRDAGIPGISLGDADADPDRVAR